MATSRTFSGTTEDRCKQNNRWTFRMAKQNKATSLSKGLGHGGKLSTALPAGYANLLADLKIRVRAAQLRAAISVNHELINL